MLTIRAEQMKTMSEPVDARFRERLVEHVARVFPQSAKGLGPNGLTTFVDDGVARARKVGFRSERQISRFLDLCMPLGPGFEKTAWARRVIEDRNHDADTRILMLQLEAKRNGRRSAS